MAALYAKRAEPVSLTAEELDFAHEEVAPGMAGAIMKKQGLRAVRMRAWKKTAVVDPAARTGHIRNHMQDGDGNRDFTATVPGIRMVGDITYLHTRSGWLPRLGHPVRPAPRPDEPVVTLVDVHGPHHGLGLHLRRGRLSRLLTVQHLTGLGVGDAGFCDDGPRGRRER